MFIVKAFYWKDCRWLVIAFLFDLCFSRLINCTTQLFIEKCYCCSRCWRLKTCVIVVPFVAFSSQQSFVWEWVSKPNSPLQILRWFRNVACKNPVDLVKWITAIFSRSYVFRSAFYSTVVCSLLFIAIIIVTASVIFDCIICSFLYYESSFVCISLLSRAVLSVRFSSVIFHGFFAGVFL